MNKIKALRDKYRLSNRQLGILMGYHPDHIQRVSTGRRNITPHFQVSLENVEKSLKNGDAKIPK